MSTIEANQKRYPMKKKYIKKILMNQREITFFEKLKIGLKGLYVFPQVSMNQILDVEQQKDYKDRYSFWAKIIDFVVCTPQCQIIAIVELDGPSHDTDEQKKKDALRDEMLKEAGYIVIRYDWRQEITERQLNRDFKKILNAWNILKLREEVKKKEKNILRALSE